MNGDISPSITLPLCGGASAAYIIAYPSGVQVTFHHGSERMGSHYGPRYPVTFCPSLRTPHLVRVYMGNTVLNLKWAAALGFQHFCRMAGLAIEEEMPERNPWEADANPWGTEADA